MASKTLSSNSKKILSTFVKVVSFVRARALNHRIFKMLCQEMGAQFEVFFISYRSSLAFKRSSFEAFDGTEKTCFIF